MIFDHENIKVLLDSEFHNGINDQLTREQLEKYLPDAICNEELNTPEVIDSQLLMFEYNGFIYEYGISRDGNTQLIWKNYTHTMIGIIN